MSVLPLGSLTSSEMASTIWVDLDQAKAAPLVAILNRGYDFLNPNNEALAGAMLDASEVTRTINPEAAVKEEEQDTPGGIMNDWLDNSEIQASVG